MQKKQYIIFALSLFALLFLCSAIWYIAYKPIESVKEHKVDEPLDVVFDFYNSWLTEAKNNGGLESKIAIISQESLSTELQNRIKASIESNNSLDPVLCQSIVPDSIRAKIVHELPTEVEAMVLARYASSTPSGFALVKLSLFDKSWKVIDISCSKGDVVEEREFTFEQEGNLLKDVPEPLNRDFWHLVFTESGQPGHTIELHFSSSTTCTNTIAPEVTCSPDSLIETTKVKVYGQASETGVDVAKIELLGS